MLVYRLMSHKFGVVVVSNYYANKNGSKHQACVLFVVADVVPINNSLNREETWKERALTL